MTPRLCHDCGDDTLTLGGWAQVDHCASCGRVLGTQPIRVDPAIEARGRMRARRSSPIPPSTRFPVGGGAARAVEEAGS